MKKVRSILENNLIQVLEQTGLRKFKDKVEEIKLYLLTNYEMSNVQGIFNDPKGKLPKLDDRELLLFAEQVYFKTHHIDEINIENFYHQREIDEARQFTANIFKEEQFIDYPIEIENASFLANDTYSVTLNIQTINKLLNSGILYYDAELQRETQKVRRYGIVIEQPKLIQKNVDEITEHLLEGSLAVTTLWFNAMPKTAISGNELEFNPKKRTLTITNGTRIAIGDGFHRITGIQNALTINPDIQFNFMIILTNHAKKKAQTIQAQMSKGTPISKVRVESLEGSRLADTVVQTLKEESDLQGKVSDNPKPVLSHNELVSYNVLASTIDSEFNITTRIEAEDVGEYLVEVFNNLLGRMPEEFLLNTQEVSKKSLINANFVFIGYVTLAKRMYENNIKPRKIVDLIKQIDFSRDNPLWQEIGVLDGQHRITGSYMEKPKLNKAIKDVFNNINLDGEMIKS